MQRSTDSRPMVEVYDANNTAIKELMGEHNRSSAYVANALIEEALVQHGKLKEVSLKL